MCRAIRSFNNNYYVLYDIYHFTASFGCCSDVTNIIIIMKLFYWSPRSTFFIAHIDSRFFIRLQELVIITIKWEKILLLILDFIHLFSRSNLPSLPFTHSLIHRLVFCHMRANLCQHLKVIFLCCCVCPKSNFRFYFFYFFVCLFLLFLPPLASVEVNFVKIIGLEKSRNVPKKILPKLCNNGGPFLSLSLTRLHRCNEIYLYT